MRFALRLTLFRALRPCTAARCIPAAAAAVVAGWMASSGHCANIMRSQFTVIGVGYAYSSSSTYRHYWTQDFGG